MKYEEIIKLLDAGYTREEIIEMDKEPEEQKPEEQKPEETKPDDSNITDFVKEMREAFAEMKKEFTAFNIMASRQPEIEEKSSEDIIANIINPTRKKKGE